MCELAFEPAVEGKTEQRPSYIVRRDFEERIDAGLYRPFAQQISAEE
jgi:hypothetical protein